MSRKQALKGSPQVRAYWREMKAKQRSNIKRRDIEALMNAEKEKMK
jgi:hypothetical protein